MERLAIEGGMPVRTDPLPYGHQWINAEDIESDNIHYVNFTPGTAADRKRWGAMGIFYLTPSVIIQPMPT